MVAFVAVLLIPVGTSSLRGLTHVLTCRQDSDIPFSIRVEGGRALIGSSQVIERPGPGEEPSEARELCGGLVLDLSVDAEAANPSRLLVAVTNRTDYGWHGSIELEVDRTRVPVSIGRIDPGDTATEAIELHLDEGEQHEIEGSLLVGP